MLEANGVGLRRKIAEALSGACENSTDKNSSYHNLALQGVIAIANGDIGELPRVCEAKNCPFSSCALRERRSSNRAGAFVELSERTSPTTTPH